MKEWFEYQTWVHPCNKETRLVGTQTEAILYVFFDIPCFFSKVELELFLGVISPNHNIGGALLKMLEAKMIIKKKNRIGTEQFYLGHFGMEALQRSTIPDIDNRPNNFLESITLRIENGNQLINERRDAKEKANGNQLINEVAARPKATKKHNSLAKTSTKITPTQKRKKMKRSPTNDCAKDTIASSSSSTSSKASSSDDGNDYEDDEDEDNNNDNYTDKEPGNNTDDNDNDDNDNDDDNDNNDNNHNSENGNDNDNDNNNDNNNDKDNNSGFMDQDLYDPKDYPEDGRIVTV
jgi:hypothetical protein